MITDNKPGAPALGIATVAILVLTQGGGCTRMRPTYMPAPLESIRLADGSTEYLYDTNDNGVVDFRERVLPTGRAAMMAYDDDEDGQIDARVTPGARNSAAYRGANADAPTASTRLLIILDSIPYAMVAGAHEGGAFRYFSRPAKVISPFPVMTDLALNAFFGESPAMAVETDYFDGQRLIDGWDLYAKEANSKWLSRIDYHRPYAQHGDAYLDPRSGFARELFEIETRLDSSAGEDVNAYMVSTSALGFIEGERGHLWGLSRLDLFCRALMHRYRGKIDITLMSDHGHQFAKARRCALDADLRKLGYRVTTRLVREGDVIIPGFGLVSCAVMHTRQPLQVARDVGSLPYVEFAACRNNAGAVELFSNDGHAVIEQGGGGYRYHCTSGDPLKLQPALDKLLSEGMLDANGFATDRAWFDATVDHPFPDPLFRLVRAFDGLVKHTPDVLVSLRGGWYYGSPFMSAFVAPRATHGSLNAESSCGFAMTTMGALPDSVRMDDLGDVLRRLADSSDRFAGAIEVMPSADPETVDRSGTDPIESMTP